MPKRRPDLDFDIYVDPSCLSDSMEDETKSPQPAEVEVEQTAPEAAVPPPTETAAEATDSVPHDDAEASTVPDQGDEATPLAETTELMEGKPGHETEGHEEEAAGDGDEVSTILPSIEDDHDPPAEDIDRYSRNSSRQYSPHTEELIQAATRDIMAEMENEGHGEHDDSDASHDEDETTRAGDEGADSSSQQGMDEDVFSERSPRSSLGSYDGGSESAKGTTIPDNATVHTRTPRVSDISQYSSHYDNDEFVPTASSKTRPPFRTPSDIRAMQMGSPPPSVYGTGSIPVTESRSQNRKFPTVSRLGSPAGSVQYSPKNRTPSRFKVKQEAPLILLHATLLPLRWMWAEIIDDLDTSEMSEDAKLLRDSWRLLQDCVGDTVVERGILLGHPQNDYEVLEERLLEALELPMRRRARILECGHYLGPANEKTIGDDGDSEDDYDTVRSQAKNHWCTTCKHEIRYESLGPGKIFRVKVYASNGLMKAGAWAACWKEMERVDIELEPIVSPAVQDELVRLAAAREEREAAKKREFDVVSNIVHQIEEEERDQPSGLHAHLNASRHGSVDARRSMAGDRPESVYSRGRSLGGAARPESAYSRKPFAEERPESVHSFSPLAEERPNSVHSRKSLSEEQRLREQARLREIYGSPEPDYAHSEAGSPRERHRDAYASKPTSPAPARDPSYERKGPRRQPAQSDSLPELLLQSIRVVLRDSKNIIIIALGVVAVLLALRKAPEMLDRAEDHWFDYSSVPRVHIPEAPIHPVQMRAQQVHHHAETLELPQPMASRQAQGTQVVEPVATYTPSVPVAAAQEVPQNTPEAPEAAPSSSESAANESYETPAVAQEAQSTLEQAAEQPQATPEVAEPETEGQTEEKTEEAEKEPEAEVVKEKKVVRVFETVTETETVKVTATATHTDAEETPSPTATAEAVADEQSEDAATQETTTTTQETAAQETATQEAATQESEPLETPIVESANEEASKEEPAQHPEEPAEEKETPCSL
ncbi:pathway-specific nitrogen regulator [Apiospora marii]|uniref:Pathway-specific nitrogen regulator n=1 Tax=Apiospora marii TaxID=335849 RepID=A0ABR1RA89_9PEZI